MESRTQDTTRAGVDVPVVGLGASAGGLDALKRFFSAASANEDVAYVVVTHRGENDLNLLPDILSKYTTMPVEEARNGATVEAGHVYVSPSAHYLRLFDGKLVYNPIVRDHVPLPIDFFFRSLGIERKEKGICILLSGGGSDGTSGLQAVKGDGGMAIVQDTASAAYPDMPASAVATGLVDYILPPEEMPAIVHQYVKRLTAAHGKGRAKLVDPEAMDEILTLIPPPHGQRLRLLQDQHAGTAHRTPDERPSSRRRLGLSTLRPGQRARDLVAVQGTADWRHGLFPR